MLPPKRLKRRPEPPNDSEGNASKTKHGEKFREFRVCSVHEWHPGSPANADLKPDNCESAHHPGFRRRHATPASPREEKQPRGEPVRGTGVRWPNLAARRKHTEIEGKPGRARTAAPLRLLALGLVLLVELESHVLVSESGFDQSPTSSRQSPAEARTSLARAFGALPPRLPWHALRPPPGRACGA